MGPEHRRPRQEEEEEDWLSRLSDSAPRPRGPTAGGSGCVEGSRGQGTRETGQGAEGRDAASGCLADIQCQCGHVFWIYMCSLDCKY